MLPSLFLLLSFAAGPTAPAPAVASVEAAPALDAAPEPEARVKFRVRNRTREDVDVYTGHGRERFRACATSGWLRLRAGAEIRLWDGSTGGEVLFEVADDMDDQTLDLADYHDTMARPCNR